MTNFNSLHNNHSFLHTESGSGLLERNTYHPLGIHYRSENGPFIHGSFLDTFALSTDLLFENASIHGGFTNRPSNRLLANFYEKKFSRFF